MAGLALAFASHYGIAVSKYLKETERAFLNHAAARGDEETARSVRSWSTQLHNAHSYRNAHGRSIRVAASGSIAWIVAYVAQVAGVGSAVFASPFGVPASFGIKLLAVIAWAVAGYDAIRVINKFGVRPEEVVSEELKKPAEAD
jgi:hypothetical protein